MKKFVALLTAVIVLALTVCSVYADDLCKVNMSANAEGLATGKTFVLTISVDDITAPEGVCSAEMILKYDPKLFKVEKVDVTTPDSWKSLDKEIWSENRASDEYYLAAMLIDTGHGAKSGEIKFNVTVKALADGANGASVKLVDIGITADSEAGLMHPYYVGDTTFKVEYGKAELEVSTEPVESDIIEDPSEDEPVVSGSENSEDEKSEDEPVVSDSENSEAGSEAESQPAGDTSAPTSEGGNEPAKDDNSGSALPIIIIAAVVVVAGVVVAVVVLGKKKK